MPSYDNEDFHFTINGQDHTLPELNIDMFESIAALYEITNPVEQMKAWRDSILAVAEPEETKTAIRNLGIKKTAALFKDWTGIGAESQKGLEPGEDSSSTV